MIDRYLLPLHHHVSWRPAPMGVPQTPAPLTEKSLELCPGAGATHADEAEDFIMDAFRAPGQRHAVCPVLLQTKARTGKRRLLIVACRSLRLPAEERDGVPQENSAVAGRIDVGPGPPEFQSRPALSAAPGSVARCKPAPPFLRGQANIIRITAAAFQKLLSNRT